MEIFEFVLFRSIEMRIHLSIVSSCIRFSCAGSACGSQERSLLGHASFRHLLFSRTEIENLG